MNDLQNRQCLYERCTPPNYIVRRRRASNERYQRRRDVLLILRSTKTERSRELRRKPSGHDGIAAQEMEGGASEDEEPADRRDDVERDEVVFHEWWWPACTREVISVSISTGHTHYHVPPWRTRTRSLRRCHFGRVWDFFNLRHSYRFITLNVGVRVSCAVVSRVEAEEANVNRSYLTAPTRVWKK